MSWCEWFIKQSAPIRRPAVRICCTVIGIAGIAVAGHAQPRVSQPPVAAPGEWDAVAHYEERARLYASLVHDADKLRARHVHSYSLTDGEERRLLERDDCASCGDYALSSTLGITLKTEDEFRFDAIEFNDVTTKGRTHSAGLLRVTNSGVQVWTTAIHAPNAGALKLRLQDVDLPKGAELYVYNLNGGAFGPYTQRNLDRRGGFWTNLLSGDTLFLELRLAADPAGRQLNQTRFTLTEIGYFSGAALEKNLQFKDATCYDSGDWSLIDYARDGIAFMTFVRDGEWMGCTGGLLANTRNDTSKHYFLSAEHCITDQSQADSLECFWRYRTANCNSQYTTPANFDHLDRTTGATFLADDAGIDFVLLRLAEAPPAGSIYLGWDAIRDYTTRSGDNLYMLSHPTSLPLSFSRHTTLGTPPGCGGYSNSTIHANNTLGGANRGSSGAPVMLASAQVVGPISSLCCKRTGTAPADQCVDDWESDPAKYDVRIGSFYHIYPSVRQWLAPDLDPDDIATSGCNMSSIAGADGGRFTDGLSAFVLPMIFVVLAFYYMRHHRNRRNVWALPPKT